MYLRGTVLALSLAGGTAVKVGNDTLALVVDDCGLVIVVTVDILRQDLVHECVQLGNVFVLAHDLFITIDLHIVTAATTLLCNDGDAVNLL